MGVPVYSIFRGKIGAVDRYLADEGRLIMVETVDDVRTKVKGCASGAPQTLPPMEPVVRHSEQSSRILFRS